MLRRSKPSMRRSIRSVPGVRECNHQSEYPRSSSIRRHKYDEWDYKELVIRPKHGTPTLRSTPNSTDPKPLMGDGRYDDRPAFFESREPRQQEEDFYNPNIMNEFDQYWTRGGQDLPVVQRDNRLQAAGFGHFSTRAQAGFLDFVPPRWPYRDTSLKKESRLDRQHHLPR